MDVKAKLGWLKPAAQVFAAAVKVCVRYDVPRMSAALAFYAAFSLAPILIIAIAISGAVFGPQAARGEVFGQLEGILGISGAETIQAMVISASKPAPGAIAAAVSAVVLALAATAVFGELQSSLNTIWEREPGRRRGVAGLFRERLLSFGMVAVVGFLLLVSLIINAVVAGVEKYISHILPVAATIVNAGGILLFIAIGASLFALTYRVVPDHRLPPKAVWIGAVVTALLFALGEALIGLYLGRTAIASTYGAAGSLLAVLLWVYYSAQITLFGAAVAKVLADRIRRPAP